MMASKEDGEEEDIIPRISNLNYTRILGVYDDIKGAVGDVRLAAPEVVDGKCYSYKADAWQFGMIMYFILSGGKSPFKFPQEIDDDGRYLSKEEYAKLE